MINNRPLANLPTRTPVAPAAVPAPAGASAKVDPSKYTVLQRHVAFFDKNGDGLITPAETKDGMDRLGFGSTVQWVASKFINGLLGPKTSGAGQVISIADIAKGKHDGDSGAIDANGNFDRAAFDKMFAQFDKDKSGSLDSSEFTAMRTAHGKTFQGKLGALAEFSLLMQKGADQTVTGAKGKPVEAISREQLLSFYDGTLFTNIAAKVAKSRGQ